MNKMIKGSVAGATGIVLLMGGFGTYALWSDSTSVDQDTLKSGALDITGTGTATWADISSTGAVNGAWDPASDKMVPGDTVKLTQPVTIDASGKNLKVKFTVTGINPGAWSNLGVTMKYDGTVLPAVAPAPTAGPAYEFVYNAPAGAALNGTKDLVVTFDFPAGVGNPSFAGNDTTSPSLTDQNETLDLNAVGIAVQQVRP
jgi:alternate signal-mediated exported protein